MGDEEIESLFRCASKKKPMRESSKKWGKVRSGVIFFAHLENDECLMSAPPQLSLAKQAGIVQQALGGEREKTRAKNNPLFSVHPFSRIFPRKRRGGGGLKRRRLCTLQGRQNCSTYGVRTGSRIGRLPACLRVVVCVCVCVFRPVANHNPRGGLWGYGLFRM